MSSLDHRALHQLLGTRWALPVLKALVAGPVRFAELKRSVPGVSARMLAQTTRALIASGLVLRNPGDRAVTYLLTNIGAAALHWSSADLEAIAATIRVRGCQ